MVSAEEATYAVQWALPGKKGSVPLLAFVLSNAAAVCITLV